MAPEEAALNVFYSGLPLELMRLGPLGRALTLLLPHSLANGEYL